MAIHCTVLNLAGVLSELELPRGFNPHIFRNRNLQSLLAAFFATGATATPVVLGTGDVEYPGFPAWEPIRLNPFFVGDQTGALFHQMGGFIKWGSLN